MKKEPPPSLVKCKAAANQHGQEFSNPINALLEALWHLAAATICQGPPTQSHQAFYQLLLI